MTEKDVKRAVSKAHNLDEASQTLRASAKKKWNRAVILCVVAFLILLAVGIYTGIRQNQLISKQNQAIALQNEIAKANKEHIDCIVKLSSTPLKPGQTRRIADLSTCQIKVSP